MGGGGRYTLICFSSDKQQSTSESWMPTSGEAGGGLGNVNWRRWGEHACTKNTMKPTIYLQVLIPTLGSDGGAEAAEATNNSATMILREGGTVLVAKIINNLC